MKAVCRPTFVLGLGLALACAACGSTESPDKRPQIVPAGSSKSPSAPPATPKALLAPAASPIPPSAPESKPLVLPPAVSKLQRRLARMRAARLAATSKAQRELGAKLDAYHARHRTRRLYVHVDKPLYRPGETIWFRVWQLDTATLAAHRGGHGISVQLLDPRGSVLSRKRIRALAGLATNDFVIPATAAGGEYVVRVRSDLGDTIKRAVIVSSYQPPRIKKKVEFLRKAYGAGDRVAAAVALHRATGEVLAKQRFTALMTVDEVSVARKTFSTDAKGNALVRLQLPAKIRRGDGLLTILVADGGVTESMQKRIPITLHEISFHMYPEGGKLVRGLPGRVYFSAKNLIGKPADVSGRVVDSSGASVTAFRSFHNGLGRFEITPRDGERYFVEITKPRGIRQRIVLPTAARHGCSLQAVDDYRSRRGDLRVALWCKKRQRLIVSAVLREKRLGLGALIVRARRPRVISLPMPRGAQGAVRVTIFDSKLTPLAERLVYRARGADLRIKLAAKRKIYSPRDNVQLQLTTTDRAGKPVEADLSLAVVDDTVLSFADDKSAHLLARIYLESEMPGQRIEEPKFYFSRHAKAPRAMDLLMGTSGWRRFDWQRVLAPQPTAKLGDLLDGALGARTVRRGKKKELDKLLRRHVAKRPPRAPAARPKAIAEAKQKRQQKDDPRLAGLRARRRRLRAVGNIAGEIIAGKRRFVVWAPVRTFPTPSYRPGYAGPRTDFRETIFWAPSVKTSASGTATVSFHVSDAITSFRATAQGVSKGGVPGVGTTLITSKLPISLAVKMPLEVSRGDVVELPITLSNETAKTRTVALRARFGAAFKLAKALPKSLTLRAHQRTSVFASLRVVGDGKKAVDGAAEVAIETAQLKDAVKRTIRVVPLGFPRRVALAGSLRDTARHTVNLAGALPGTLSATVTMYPSPLATMVKGTESIIREPSGCFEQASSANYPNVMALDYMRRNNAANADIVARAMQMLDRGYKKLVGYESKTRGFEWFGSDPGHEALTAYGLMEFADMTKVFGKVDRTMLGRTAAWLRARRDGKGGYKRNPRALDSFGRASAEVTNGYITYALSEAGVKDLAPELRYQRRIARTTRDPYLMALAANVLANLARGSSEAAAAARKLLAMQGKSGAFEGADHSITRSGGRALTIETTALAVMALLKGGEPYLGPVRRAVTWINGARGGSGGFGSTQSTILALRALSAYSEASRRTRAGGRATLFVNGKRAGDIAYSKGHSGALVFAGIGRLLHAGKNTVELRLASKHALPYSIGIEYRTTRPASSAGAATRLATELQKRSVALGESVRLKVRLENVTKRGIPMTLARVGLPGGLTFQTWQLKELRKKRVIGFYETREREVILYFRALAPEAVKEINLDLIARVPGRYIAPASSAYLYYTDELKHWAKPLDVTVTR
ncbi:MAG: hypothetical protein KC503_27415 [Myxococcales bacterium]|nr:hypothetical protein [Myxococcales bacterium]